MNENDPKSLGETVDNLTAAKKVLDDKSEQHGAKVCTISGNLPDPTYPQVESAPQPIGTSGQHKDYYVLCPEERAKGFVRPYRDAYKHVGIAGPKYPLRDLTPEESERYKQFDYVKFEAYPEGSHGAVTGCFWTQDRLNNIGKGCGSVTTMGRALSETYARDPNFYGATFCVSCGNHYPVDEFVWIDDSGRDSRVGS